MTDPRKFKAPYNPKERIWQEADRLRAAHPAGRSLPVQVLDLAEFDLGLDLIPANGLREHYARGRIIGETEDGFPIVETFMDQDSSLLVPLAASDCLVVQAAGDGGMVKNDRINIIKLGPN